MHKLLVAISVSLTLAGCNAGASARGGAQQVGAGLGDAVTAPLDDLNLRRQEIPTVLLQAESNPYDLRNLTHCRTIAAEIAPCFVTAEDGRRTDVVCLACTHYPLLRARFEHLAPWPVAWIDPAPAIARRVTQLLGGIPRDARSDEGPVLGAFTGGATLTERSSGSATRSNAAASKGS